MNEIKELKVDVNVKFDHQKVEALVEEFKQRLVTECMVVTVGNETQHAVTAVNINATKEVDVEKVMKSLQRPGIVMGG